MNPAEAYILEKPEPFKSMLLQVQVIIENTLPEFDLLFKWKLPFYFSEKCPICYLNVSKGYLDVCFFLSDQFAVQYSQLISEKRKLVKSLRYFNIEEIDAAVLVSCLQEAYLTKGKGFKAD